MRKDLKTTLLMSSFLLTFFVVLSGLFIYQQRDHLETIDLVWFMNLMLGVTMLLGLCIGAITMSIKGVLVGFLSPLVSCIAMVYVYNTIRPLWGSADLSLPILLILIIFVWFTVPVAILHVAEWFQGLWSKFAAGTTSPR